MDSDLANNFNELSGRISSSGAAVSASSPPLVDFEASFVRRRKSLDAAAAPLVSPVPPLSGIAKIDVTASRSNSVKRQSNRVKFSRKLLLVVMATLHTAAQHVEERSGILSELFSNLSALLEPKVIDHFLADGSIVPGQTKFGNRHYYELASDALSHHLNPLRSSPALVLDLDTLVNALRSNETFHCVYAMIIYNRLSNMQNNDFTVKQLNLFCSGAEKLFTKDRDARTFVYRPLYQSLRRMLANYRCWNRSMVEMIGELWMLWAAFCFFYEKRVDYVRFNVEHFRLERHLQRSRELGNDCLVLDSSMQAIERSVSEVNSDLDDTFVRTVVKQFGSIRDEGVLVRYLRFAGECFEGMQGSLARSTFLFLQSELYLCTKPGNPYYMPDKARAAASLALSKVSPNGALSRNLVSLWFRLFQPYYSLVAVAGISRDYVYSTAQLSRDYLTKALNTFCWCCRKREKTK
jgi:hypothetical protein